MPGLAPHGAKDASDDEDTVRTWWKRYPQANIALATGGEVFVVDLDGAEAWDAFAELCDQHGDNAERIAIQTAVAETGREGGLHLWFGKDPELRVPCSAGKLAPGVDVRGEGGYVIAPPSLHMSGRRYRWRDGHEIGQIHAAPPWLLQIVAAHNDEHIECAALTSSDNIACRHVDELTLTKWRDLLGYIDPDCSRDEWFRVLAAFKDDCHGADNIRDVVVLLDEWSSGKLHGKTVGSYQGFHDVERVFSSFVPKPDGVTIDSAFSMATSNGWSWDWRRYCDPALARSIETLGERMATKREANAAERAASQEKVSRFCRIPELEARLGSFESLVDGVLPQKGYAQLFGDPGAGKSTVVVNLCVAIAGRLPSWCGQPLRSRSGRVLYLAGEGYVGLLERFRAAAADLGVPQETVEQNVLVSREPGSLSDPRDANAWLEEARDAWGDSGTPDLIVVDTQSACFGPGDPNSTQDAGRFNANVTRMAYALDCLSLVIHHSGHANKDRARGSSSVGGALDADWRCEMTDKQARTVKLRYSKAKDFEPVPVIHGAIVGVDPGLGRSVACFRYTGLAAPEPICEDPIAELVDAIRALHAQGESTPTMRRLVEVTSARSKATVKDRLEKAVRQGRLKRAGTAYLPVPGGENTDSGGSGE